MSVTLALTFACIGLLGGTFGTLLGLGGGVLFVPCLYEVFKFQGFETEIAFPLAVGTSLATIMVTSISGALGHSIHGNLNPRNVLLMAGMAVPSALAGAVIGSILGGLFLKRLFGAIALLLSIQFIRPVVTPHSKHENDLRTGDCVVVGGVSGLVSAVIGVGGGAITVPLLHLVYDIPIRQAAATSSGLIVFSSFAGAVGWITSGLDIEGLPAGTIGYLHPLAWVMVSFFAVVGAQAGAWGTAVLRQRWLRRIFGVVLLIVGLRMTLAG